MIKELRATLYKSSKLRGLYGGSQTPHNIRVRLQSANPTN